MEQGDIPGDASHAASRPSFVQHFSIDGLYGYRSVSLDSAYAATVLIARNGSGKTTLIAALDAFLRGQFARFSGLRFETITCKLRDLSDPLVIFRSDIEQLIDFATNSEVATRAKAWEIEPLALLELLEGGFSNPDYNELMGNPTFYAIYGKLGYDFRVTRSQCEKLAASLRGAVPKLNTLRDLLRQALRETEIVYLPTYRRIELSLPTADARYGGPKKSLLSRLGIARSGLYTADIQFGLNDISEKLSALYSEMLFQANRGYGKVSANVINDLITGNYKASFTPKTPPTKESLEIFFARIKDAEREYRRPYPNFLATPDLNRVYSGDIPEDSKPFLTYFLNQLNSVIEETRGTEELVAAFIDSCNRYLSGDDESTDMYSDGPYDFYDKKQLTFNRSNLKVKVTSTATGQDVPMEALSSGEKQMISLFARLYLYPGPKIVLIDEPELSLSLDWQRHILPDVLLTPTCRQVIAITHSPFIFDNELERFAGALRFRIRRNKNDQQLPHSEYDDETGEEGEERE